MKQTFIAIAVLLITVQFTTAQDIQINGKAFLTVKKTVLNTEIDYYLVKEKANAASGSQSYIKTGGVFNKTIFSEAELKKFVSTGKASSFGVVKERQVNPSHKLNYIEKGNILILIAVNKSKIQFVEVDDKSLADLIKGAVLTMGKKKDGSPTDYKGLNDCGDVCFDALFGDGGNDAGCIDDDGGQSCQAALLQCWNACKDKFGSPSKPGNSINLYAITLKGLTVSIK